MKTMNKYSLNLGRPPQGEVPIGQEIGDDGNLCVPFYCQLVPEGSVLLYVGSKGMGDGLIARKVYNTYLLGDYAYFTKP
jgi:hypothetical protein